MAKRPPWRSGSVGADPVSGRRGGDRQSGRERKGREIEENEGGGRRVKPAIGEGLYSISRSEAAYPIRGG